MRLTESLRSLAARLARRPLVASAAVVLPLALAGSGAAAAQSAFSSGWPAGPAVSADPHLTTNTSVCGGSAPAGVMHCFAIARTPSNHVITADSSGPPSTALTPADIQSAYALPSATAGGGQTVAIADAGDDPTAESDLAVFRSQFGLPSCTTANGCLKIVNQEGQTSPLPPEQCGGNTGGCWPVEESLDLDAVSSACPNCNIVLVEANDAANADLEAAVNEAVALGAKFVSNSYGGPETPSETTTDDAAYNHPGVVVTASAGDNSYGVIYPSASQYVTAVGGTTLTKDTSVARGWDETVWGSASGGEGTGSGCSAYEPQPSSQQGISQLDAVCGNRAVADVSADADPNSGLAIYDTTAEGGWLQVGGTSLSSPLIAATYALAGTPAPGTYPNAYPYHDTSQSSDLFDIRSGSNGNCGNLLCQAGPGWDGPTGLGTPDGVKAFQGAPQGQVSGQVTDQTTGQPVAGATVTAQPGDYLARTDASGTYNLTLAGGTYTLTAADYGYNTGTQSAVQVTVNQTVTENFALIPEPSGTLAGTVTDGSGHGWPLHAQISIPGYPSGSIWTGPYTGDYSVTLPQGDYALTVSTDYPGYQDKTVQVTVGPGTTTQNVTLDADLTACTAPGYGPQGLSQDFAGWAGGAPKDGWTVSSGVGRPDRGPGGPGWRFDNPGNRPPPPSGWINPAPGTTQREFVEFTGDDFAVADACYYAPRPLHTALTSRPVNLTGQSTPAIGFDSAYYPDVAAGPGRSWGNPTASVQLSTDGGRTWVTVWQQDSSNALGPLSIPVPQVAGHTSVQARWVFTGSGMGYWAIGDVTIGTPGCATQKGGLLAGTVTEQASGGPVNGATVTSGASPQPQPWPAGISLGTADPALPGGYYWLFVPSGRQQLTAAAAGFATAKATVTVKPGQVTQQDWALTALPAGTR
jgi:hypothetical protein